MPDVVSKIPIGFNLDGYDFVSKSNTESSSFAMSGVDAAWSGGLTDNRWVSDESLKQVQFECTNFQSVPLIYINQEGKKQYVILSDRTGYEDGVGTSGDSAYGGSIYADCKLASKNVLEAWSEKNKKFNGGASDEFSVGVGICPVTLANYINHFYNLPMDVNRAEKLAQTHALCVEVLYNTSETQGKALRLKVVDSSGQGGGYQGSYNRTGGWKYAYDVLDTMGAVMVTNAFDGIATMPNTKLGLLNGSELYFPWKDQSYNYKTGTIPGYSPTALMSLGLIDSEEKVPLCSVGFKSHHTVQGHALARGRFFADEGDSDKIRKVIPDIPDDFFKTNYADGSMADFNVSLVGISDAAERIRIMAKTLSGNIANQHFYYGNGSFIADDSGKFKYKSKNNTIDCDTFVDWVLTEAGIKTTPAGSIGAGIKARDWTADRINREIASGYKAVDIGTDVSNAQVGDILIWGKGSLSHAGIFGGLTNSKVTEYGMGWWTYTGRTADSPHSPTTAKTQPHNSMSPSGLSRIIRIAKA